MPAFQPSVILPIWADTPTGPENTPVDPGAPLSAKGWDAGDRVGAQHLNYQLHYITAWLVCLGYYVTSWFEHFSGTAFVSGTGPWSMNVVGTPSGVWSCGIGDSGSLFMSLPARRGAKIKNVRVYVASTNATNTDISARLMKFAVTLGSAPPTTQTDIVALTNMGASNSNVQVITLTPGGGGYETVEYEQYTVQISANTTSGSQRCYGLTVEYENP
jgi:hypothetical protein